VLDRLSRLLLRGEVNVNDVRGISKCKYLKDCEVNMGDDAFDTKTFSLVEQLRDIWDGRSTYNDDGEWLDNVHEAVRNLQSHIGA
jgi:hypothetical protein